MQEIMAKFKKEEIDICLKREDLPFLDILEQIFGDIVWGRDEGTINSSFTRSLLDTYPEIYLVHFRENLLLWSYQKIVKLDQGTIYASDLINSIKNTFEVSEKEIENLILP